MPDPNPPALVVEGAEKVFDGTRALAGAAFHVRTAELVGLLGPNGAGKTTIIRAIAGRLRLDAGSITVFGRTLAPDDGRPEIGVVPQDLAIYPLLTARENLEVFGSLYGVPRSRLRERVDWALEWSDLADRARTMTKTFSGGMKRRLNIACSLLHEPRLVLLDEPTVGVDPQSRERIYEMLDALRARGVSIVLTTHHLEEAERRCERIIIIDHGRIIASGTLAELVGRKAGALRTLRFSLAAALGPHATLPAGARADEARTTVTAHVTDVGHGAGEVLAALTAAGAEVTNVATPGPTLQDVFISLTGRALRE